MKLSEFKAFLEGLEHGFVGDAPSPEQWQLIKDKLHQVQAETIPTIKRNWEQDPIGPWRIDVPTRYLDNRLSCGKAEV